MHKRARKHRTITEDEIEKKLAKRDEQRLFSHGPRVIEQRRLKRNILWALKQISIYNRRPWESQWRE